MLLVNSKGKSNTYQTRGVGLADMLGKGHHDVAPVRRKQMTESGSGQRHDLLLGVLDPPVHVAPGPVLAVVTHDGFLGGF